MTAGHWIEAFLVWTLEADSAQEEKGQVLFSRVRLSQVEELLKFHPNGPLERIENIITNVWGHVSVQKNYR